MFGIVPSLIGVVAGLAIPIHVDTFQCAVCTDPAQPVLVAAAVAVILLDPLLYALAGWRAARRLGRTGAGVQSALLASVVAGVVSGISIVLGIHTLELRLNPAIASFATTSAAISAAVGLVATLGISAFFG